jgi:hypothetical protein
LSNLLEIEVNARGSHEGFRRDDVCGGPASERRLASNDAPLTLGGA